MTCSDSALIVHITVAVSSSESTDPHHLWGKPRQVRYPRFLISTIVSTFQLLERVHSLVVIKRGFKVPCGGERVNSLKKSSSRNEQIQRGRNLILKGHRETLPCSVFLTSQAQEHQLVELGPAPTPYLNKDRDRLRLDDPKQELNLVTLIACTSRRFLGCPSCSLSSVPRSEPIL